MNQNEKIVIAAKVWRETERKVIADKADGEKQREHYQAKMKLRDAVDVAVSKGTPP